MLQIVAIDRDQELAARIAEALANKGISSTTLSIDDAEGELLTRVSVSEPVVALWTNQSADSGALKEIACSAFGRSMLVNVIVGKVELPIILSMVQHIVVDADADFAALAGSLSVAEHILHEPRPVVGDGQSYLFVSYARKDAARLEPVLTWLNELGVPYWFDRNIKAGAWSNDIDHHLRKCTAALVLWTKCSAASPWVAAEAASAYQDSKLLGLQLEPCEPPAHLRLGWSHAKRDLESLLIDMARYVKTPQMEALLAIYRLEDIARRPIEPISSGERREFQREIERTRTMLALASTNSAYWVERRERFNAAVTRIEAIPLIAPPTVLQKIWRHIGNVVVNFGEGAGFLGPLCMFAIIGLALWAYTALVGNGYSS